jgi:hypothetical protein
MSLDAAEQRRVRPAQHGSDGRRALVDLPRPGQNRPLPLATPAAADTGPGQPPGWAEDDNATETWVASLPRWDDNDRAEFRHCPACWNSGCDVSYLGVKIVPVDNAADCDCLFCHDEPGELYRPDYDAPDPERAIRAVPIAAGVFVPLACGDDTVTDMRPWQPHAGPAAWRSPDLPRPGQNRPLPLATPAAADTGPGQPPRADVEVWRPRTWVDDLVDKVMAAEAIHTPAGVILVGI